MIVSKQCDADAGSYATHLQFDPNIPEFEDGVSAKRQIEVIDV